MKGVLESIAKLIRVKTFITVAVILVFCHLAVVGKIPSDDVVLIASMIVSFFFGTQHEKKGGNSDT